MKALLLRLAALCLSSLIALLAAEAAIRLLVPEPRWRFRDASEDWRVDPALGWVQKPALDVTTINEQGEVVRFTTNADGLRPASARPERRPGALRILLVGDSTAVGRAVREEDAVHSRLTAELAARGVAAEVLNAGVEGYSTDQALLRLRALLPRYRPDLVAYAFCANDLGGNAVERAYGVPKPRFVQAGGRLVAHLPLPAAGGIPAFGGGPRSWLQHAALYRLIRPALTGLRARLGGFEERNLAGVGDALYWRGDAAASADWALLAALLAEMDRAARDEGARFFFYAHPALEEVWEPAIRRAISAAGVAPERYDRRAVEARLETIAGAEQLTFCPLIDTFIREEGRGPFHLLPRDPHCNAMGYRVQAEALAACLASRELLAR